MAINYPTFQSDPNVNTLTASAGISSSGNVYISGNVGIGTTAPSAKIHVHTGPQWSGNNYGANIVVGGSRNNAIGLLDSTNSNAWAIANAGGKMQFSTMPPLGNTSSTPSQYVTFNNNGDVGIGTTNPTTTMDVRSANLPVMRLSSSWNNGSVGLSDILFGDYYNNAGFGAGFLRILSSPADSFFHITPYGLAQGNIFSVGSNGKVGIGTASPATKLSVVGQISVVSGNVGEDLAYKGTIVSTKTGSSNQHINIIRAGNHVRSIGYAPNSNTFLIAGGEPDDSNFGNNIPFAIDNQGNVGIGTTVPEQKLQVGNETGQQIARIAGGDSGINGGSALYLGAGSGLDIYALGHYSAINGGAYNDTLTLYAAGGRPVYFQTGLVGIGTSTPAYKLDVSGAGRFTSNVEITGTLKGLTQLSSSAISASTYIGLPVSAEGAIYIGDKTISGSLNVSSSINTLQSITSSGDILINNLNIGKGTGTGANNTWNTSVGIEVLLSNSSGTNNTGIGWRALSKNTTGRWNIAVGTEALTQNTTGDANVGVGYRALINNISGGSNIAIGHSALSNNTYGGSNVGIGLYSLQFNITGSSNTGIGNLSLYRNTNGFYNTAVGSSAGRDNTVGNYNSSFGYAALAANIDGVYNTAIGSFTLLSNKTGSNNTAVGRDSMLFNTSGSNNTAVGRSSLFYHTSGNYNSVLGDRALLNLINGDYNTAIGALAASGSTNLSGCVVIGGNNGTSIDNTTGSIVISDGFGNIRIQADNTGLVTIPGSLSVAGGQIKFPATQVPSADPNTLDDYEEGTWIPELSGNITNNFTYTMQTGSYTIVGRMVTATAYIFVSSTGSSNGGVFLSLPIAPANVSGSGFINGSRIGASGDFINGPINGSNTNILLYKFASPIFLPLSASTVGNNTAFNLVAHYRIS